ncbi:MAG: VOC family protein [Planctomycetota bacterium]
MTVQPIPDGFRTVTPHLIIDGCAKALDFYGEAFGAQELMRAPMEGTDKLMHASIKIGDSIVMLADAFPDWGSPGPDPKRNSPVMIHLFVEDVDAAYDRAVKAGATAVMPVQDQFWGDRYGLVQDPFGHRWSIATRTKDLTPEEMAEGARKAFGGGQ